MEEVKSKLAQSQLRKLAHALRNNIDLTPRLNNKDIPPTAGVPLLLTKREINQNNLNKGNSHNINFSVSRLERMKKNGGFIQALLPFLSAILCGVSAITGIAKKYQRHGHKQKSIRYNLGLKYSRYFTSC